MTWGRFNAFSESHQSSEVSLPSDKVTYIKISSIPLCFVNPAALSLEDIAMGARTYASNDDIGFVGMIEESISEEAEIDSSQRTIVKMIPTWRSEMQSTALRKTSPMVRPGLLSVEQVALMRVPREPTTHIEHLPIIPDRLRDICYTHLTITICFRMQKHKMQKHKMKNTRAIIILKVKSTLHTSKTQRLPNIKIRINARQVDCLTILLIIRSLRADPKLMVFTIKRIVINTRHQN